MKVDLEDLREKKNRTIRRLKEKVEEKVEELASLRAAHSEALNIMEQLTACPDLGREERHFRLLAWDWRGRFGEKGGKK